MASLVLKVYIPAQFREILKSLQLPWQLKAAKLSERSAFRVVAVVRDNDEGTSY